MAIRGLNAQRFTLPDSSVPDLRKVKRSNNDQHNFDGVRTEMVKLEVPKTADMHNESAEVEQTVETRVTFENSVQSTSFTLRRLWGCRRLTFLITLPLVIPYLIGQFFPSVRMPQKLIGTLCTPMGIICSCALPDLFTPLSAINCNADYYHTLCDGREVQSPPSSDTLDVIHIVPATTNVFAHPPSSTTVLTVTSTAPTTVPQMVHEPDAFDESRAFPDEPDVNLDESVVEVKSIVSPPSPQYFLSDFGLAESGAKVFSALTSPTEGLGSLSYAAGLMAVLRGYDKTQMHINPPLVVLEEQVSALNCWQFAGSQGHITVSLSDTIIWTHFTLHFPEYLDGNNRKLRQAPKILIMRALVTKSEVQLGDLDSLVAWEQFVTVDQLVDSSLFNLSSAFLEVARVSYRPLLGGRQTFSTHIPVRTSIVLIEILDNWGDTSTCLHRISFHGERDNM
ncbi:hypothetical protein EV361DRAFT_954664 [Lentinula raphanica]|nr:hypothetical protein EV361DRAFT_954664 [Lentinula raphanica]